MKIRVEINTYQNRKYTNKHTNENKMENQLKDNHGKKKAIKDSM